MTDAGPHAAPDTASPSLTDTIADPGPLGLAAFAATTFVLSCFNAGLIGSTLTTVVLPLALFYGGASQFVAGMWEFRKANTFGATAFTSYGAFWLSFAAYLKFVVPQLPVDSAHQATGLYLLAWAIFTTYMAVAAVKVNGAVLSVFVALAATFIVLAVGEFAQSTGVSKLGGWLGLITALLAWYTSFAGVTNATWRRQVLPTWPTRG